MVRLVVVTYLLRLLPVAHVGLEQPHSFPETAILPHGCPSATQQAVLLRISDKGRQQQRTDKSSAPTCHSS